MARSISKAPMRAALQGAVLVLGLATAASAATFPVNSTADNPDINPGDGLCDTGFTVVFGMFGIDECTLRAAIQEANALAGADRITFSGLIPLDAFGTVMIAPTTELPWITTEVEVDGTTVPEFEENSYWAWPIVYVNGVNAASGSGLTFSGPGTSGSSVVGVGLVNWPSHGLHLLGAPDMVVQRCGVGIYKGTLAQGNGGNGINVTGDGNTIGRECFGLPACTGFPNLISGNAGWGVNLASDDNVVAGNRIGVDYTGQLDRGNDLGGIIVLGLGNGIGGQGVYGHPPQSPPVVSGNSISGNGGPGIRISGWTNEVYGNIVGIDYSDASIPNDGDGIRVNNTPNVIGAAGPSGGPSVASNIVSSNAGSGIVVDDPGPTDVALVEGNIVGLNAGGLLPRGNDAYGIFLGTAPGSIVRDNVVGANGTSGILVGPAAPGSLLTGNFAGTNLVGDDVGNLSHGIVVLSDDNVVGGGDAPANTVGGNDSVGIWVNGANNTIAGNFIGTNADGDVIGNGLEGVYVSRSTTNNVIGAEHGEADANMAALANVIAYNGFAGIGLGINTGRIAMRGNTYIANTALDIDIEIDGTTPNDGGDGDMGANDLMNHPEIDVLRTGYNAATGQLQITYLVDALPGNASYPLDVDFMSDAGATAGLAWIARDAYSAADAGLRRTIAWTPPRGVSIIGASLSATATDADLPGNTSEASPGITVPEPGAAAAMGWGVLGLVALRRARRR